MNSLKERCPHCGAPPGRTCEDWNDGLGLNRGCPARERIANVVGSSRAREAMMAKFDDGAPVPCRCGAKDGPHAEHCPAHPFWIKRMRETAQTTPGGRSVFDGNFVRLTPPGSLRFLPARKPNPAMGSLDGFARQDRWDDSTIRCVCGAHFTWSGAELQDELQEFATLHGPHRSGLPKRSECHCECHKGVVTHFFVVCCEPDR